MAGKANPCGKTRPVDKPYEVWTSRDGAWEIRVLKNISSTTASPMHDGLLRVKSRSRVADGSMAILT